MTNSTPSSANPPNLVNRIRSRQAGHPSGLLGRVIGRLMVMDTADDNDAAVEHLELSAPSTVLEVGFGQGRTVAKLINGGHRVIGADVAETMVKQARARNRLACRDGRAVLLHSDGHKLPFESDSAACGITVHTIYFAADAPALLDEIARVLRPGGRLVIAARVADDDVPAWVDRSVYRFLSVDQVRAALSSAGFTQIVHLAGDPLRHNTHMFIADLPATQLNSPTTDPETTS